jgi:hypothetical protein
MTLRQLSLRIKANKHIKPGRFALLMQEITKGKAASFRQPATPTRAAWLLLCYAAFPGSRNSLSFKQWQSEQKAYFDKLTEAGEPNPLDFLTEVLSDPRSLDNIQAIGVEGNTLAVMIYTAEGEVKFLTKLVRQPAETLVNMAYFPADLLRQIAADVAKVETDLFNLN